MSHFISSNDCKRFNLNIEFDEDSMEKFTKEFVGVWIKSSSSFGLSKFVFTVYWNKPKLEFLDQIKQLTRSKTLRLGFHSYTALTDFDNRNLFCR